MSSTETKLASPAPQNRAPVSIGRKGLELKTIEEMFRFANAVASSGLAPKGLEKPEAIFVALQLGFEVGLTPMAALQNIAPINGRPGLWGDAVLAVCRSTSELEAFEEWFERGPDDKPVRLARNPMEYPDDLRAVCRVKRTGYPAAEVAFSVADAKRAGLWGKSGPWTQYPFRMLKARARSFALRDQFGDALRGIRTVEELQDEPRSVAGRVVEDASVPATTPLLTAQKEDPKEPTTRIAPSVELISRVQNANLDVSRVNEFLRDNEFVSLDVLTDDEAASVLAVFDVLAKYAGGAA